MKTLKTFAVLALSVSLFTGCVSNKNAVITINDKPITKAEYQKAFDAVAKNSMVAQLGIDLKKDENSFVYLMLKDRVVNELIVKKLLDQDIESRHIKVTTDEVNKELRTIIDQVGSKDKFNEVLKQNGISANQFKKDLEEEVRIKKLIDELQLVNISDKDAEKYYKANVDKFKHPERVKASHILVSANKDEIKAIISEKEENKNLAASEIEEKVREELSNKYDKAKRLLDLVKQDPTQFAKVAKENSDDPGSARQGGDLGFFSKEQMVEEFSKTAFSLKPGTISGIVTTPFGYHIIMVTDRQEAGLESFDKVKADIKNFLANQKRVEVLQKHVDKLKNEAKIEFVDESYNPANIQKQIKEKTEENEALKKDITKDTKATK